VTPFPFIVGRGRSGTTLIRAMLDSHPDVAIPQESHFVVNMGRRRHLYGTEHGFANDRFVQDLVSHWGFKRWGIPAAEIMTSFVENPATCFSDAVRRAYEINAWRQGKRRFGDKTPGYVMHIPMLAELFTDGVFVHVIRDGRNVALSYIAGGWRHTSVAEAAVSWKRFVEQGRKAGRRLGPGRYIEIRYEDMIEDPASELRSLCRFLDLSFDPQMLQYYERADTVVGDVKPHLRRAHKNLHLPPTKGLRTWVNEMSRDDIITFEALAGDLLIALGYERVTGQLPIMQRMVAKRRWAGVQALRAVRRARKLIVANP
jgi:hypothetical protein